MTRKIIAIGEAMLEMAPVEGGLFRLDFAGDTFNTVWHAAQLLGPDATAGFVTRVGTDKLSDRFLAEMAADGLDVSAVARDTDREMGLYLIELDGAERSFHYWRQSSAARRLADDRSSLSKAVAEADIIHVSGITLAILAPAARDVLYAVLDAARASGALVAFDPNIRPRLWSSREETRHTVRQMLDRTDIALPSFDDEAALWGDTSPLDTVERLCSLGVREVVVKNGPLPVWFRSSELTEFRNTPPVAELRDTTGAGDAFNAGYLSSRLLGSAPAEAISLAQALAAVVIGTPGARAPICAVRKLSQS
jgi:2-dehydro-3-deoxygluconokinase